MTQLMRFRARFTAPGAVIVRCQPNNYIVRYPCGRSVPMPVREHERRAYQAAGDWERVRDGK